MGCMHWYYIIRLHINTVDVVPQELVHMCPQLLEAQWSTTGNEPAEPDDVAPLFHGIAVAMRHNASVPVGKAVWKSNPGCQHLHVRLFVSNCAAIPVNAMLCPCPQVGQALMLAITCINGVVAPTYTLLPLQKPH